MKKISTLGIILLSVTLLTACGDSESKVEKEDTKTASSKTATPNPKEDKVNDENNFYGLGETWEVDGLWKLTINSVTATDERNEFSDKEPAQVVFIDYTYENIGYEGSIQDLFMTPSTVVDSAGLMGDTYPANVTVNPQPTPIGATSQGVQAAYGLETAGGSIKVTFSQYDSDYKQHSATFEVPVQ